MDRLDQLLESGTGLENMEDGQPLRNIRDRVQSANVYFGAAPIAEALSKGAQVVITGRTTDTGLALGPMLHEFKWRPDDWNRLAAGTIAGHIIECGAQCTGGNSQVDWKSIRDFVSIGYPIVEASRDGSFVVTKHQGTGGRITVAGIKEQLLYEMGDPRTYITPDCIADFTTVRLDQEGEDRVRVSGIEGRESTDFYKVSISYSAGYKAVGSLVYSWPDAVDKARAADSILRRRLDELGLKFDRVHSEIIGAGALHGDLASQTANQEAASIARQIRAQMTAGATGGATGHEETLESCSPELPEVLLRVGVRARTKDPIERFVKELAPLGLNGPPTVCGLGGGRPKVEEIVAYWPALIPKSLVSPEIEIVPA
jgi:hypothetical protein